MQVEEETQICLSRVKYRRKGKQEARPMASGCCRVGCLRSGLWEGCRVGMSGEGRWLGLFFEYSLVYFRFCGLNLFYLLKKINCTIYVRKAAVEKKQKQQWSK